MARSLLYGLFMQNTESNLRTELKKIIAICLVYYPDAVGDIDMLIDEVYEDLEQELNRREQNLLH